ncbi:MAG: STAS domain-containing protein [Methanomicrobiaceae archaeon]|nr:STAS domain-containing protein [Methanomicrobiaceae archaeon]
MSGSLDVSNRQVNGVDVVFIRGRMDAHSSTEAGATINGLIEGGSRRIVVNLSGLEYISSSGLRILLSALKQLKKEDGALKLACLQPSVREVFAMAGFDRIFLLYDDEESAVNSFA